HVSPVPSTLSLPVSPLTYATADTLHIDNGVPDVVMTLSRTPAVGGVSAASVEVFASLNVYVITALAVTVISVLGVMTVTLAESRSPESDAKFTVTWCVVPVTRDDRHRSSGGPLLGVAHGVRRW